MGQVGQVLVRTGDPPSEAGTLVGVFKVGTGKWDAEAAWLSIPLASSDGAKTAPRLVREFRLMNSRRETFFFAMLFWI
jgi:hypothetical protein